MKTKTRFSSLVSIKKNDMQKSEREVQELNLNLQNAQIALQNSIEELQNIPIPQHGQISQFLSMRKLLDVQRGIIKHNEEWVKYAQNQLNIAKENLKKSMMEYEKFNYLELQEIEEMIKKQKEKDSKELDEIALMTYIKKQN